MSKTKNNSKSEERVASSSDDESTEMEQTSRGEREENNHKSSKEHDNEDGSEIEPHDDQEKHEVPTLMSSFKKYIFGTWLNVLLVFVPVGIALGIADVSKPATFAINFIAIIPMAPLIGDATEQIAIYTGATIGALLNVTFGNAVELIVSIIALKSGLISIVQASLLGSILSNLLLVLGTCFIVGGSKYKVQTFNKEAVQTGGGILLMSALCMLFPAALKAQLLNSNTTDTLLEVVPGTNTTLVSFFYNNPEIQNKLLIMSRGSACIVFIVYFLYIYFQVFSHKELFVSDEDDDGEEPELTLPFAIVALVIVTILVSICADFLVNAIESVVHSWGISESFISVILLPIIGNATEHAVSVLVAYKNKMDIAIGIAVGSAQQIAIMMISLMVIFGWFFPAPPSPDLPMSFFFDIFQTAVLLICVIVVNQLLADGKGNWFKGVILIAIYCICAIGFWIL